VVRAVTIAMQHLSKQTLNNGPTLFPWGLCKGVILKTIGARESSREETVTGSSRQEPDTGSSRQETDADSFRQETVPRSSHVKKSCRLFKSLACISVKE
jgi:hypothetical protein